MHQTQTQTQICIFEPQIYSFLFQHFVKSLRKHPKSHENQAFCAGSCKIVISDKKQRVDAAYRIQPFIKATLCRFDSGIINASKWGVEVTASPHFEDLQTNRTLRPHFEALKLQILRYRRQRKSLGESREFQWVVLIHWFFAFPLCPKSLKDRFLLPEFTKSFLKKAAKYDKIEASQKKEVL